MDGAKFLASISPLNKLYEKVIELSMSFLDSEISLLRGVDSELEKLKWTVAKIHALLRDAEDRRHIKDDAVRLWLRNLRDVALDADDLLDEVQTWITTSRLHNSSTAAPTRKRSWYAAFLSPPSPLILFRRRVAKEIVEIRGRLEEISRDRERLRPRMGEAVRRARLPDAPPSAAIFPDEPNILGIDEDRNRIVNLLVSEGAPRPNSELPVIPIYGMAGMGKTTLAKYVFNSESVVQRFGTKRVWVCATQGFGVERITREILESVTGEACRLSNFSLLQCRAREHLSGDPFLLVLDDVREEGSHLWDFLRACFPVGEGRSRVLITTRSEEVARRMGTVLSERVGGLSELDCFSLLAARAFPNGELELEQHVALRKIGMEVATKCQGSPLAAISLGGLLYLQSDETEWQSILTETMEFPQTDGDILPKLRVTYEHLPLHLKRCFAYCSIFPDGHLFDKDDLVRLWMAEGFLDSKGHEGLETIGRRYFDELVWRLFFQMSDGIQNQERKYRMPSLIHELAKSVSTHECFRLECGATQRQDVSKEARHSLLFCPSGKSITLIGLYDYSKLRTLVLKGEGKIEIGKLPSDLFLKLRCLRVLDLGDSKISELPDSVGELKHLRYLSLYKTFIERLPESLTSLCNLQTLELGGCCNLVELPLGMSNLINLRYLGLYLDECMPSLLMSMPPGIGKLTSLQTLSRFVVGTGDGCGVSELKNLKLRGELCISMLENIVSWEDARGANLHSKSYLHSLALRWSDNRQPNVRDRWNFLPSLGRQPALKELLIEGMHGVRSMDNILSSGGISVRFPSLNKLTLWDLPSLDTLSVSEVEVPHLCDLYVSHCPRLMEFVSLPSSVKKLVIKHCSELSALPKLPLLQDLTVEACHWKVLEDISNHTSLTSLAIFHIPKLKFIQKGALQSLSSLQRMEIKGCERLVSIDANEGL
ncbi:hypothetical protein Taro_010217 [Colocasia esculenta]|uniref:Uncharacterized protein n=1 Tax=Colocasia esculenta TaxID=4460 RepID=A0A843U2Q6_COLES|nr:hypothetical protein [Colocasia esculenta]